MLKKFRGALATLMLSSLVVTAGCSSGTKPAGGDSKGASSVTGISDDALSIAKARGLKPEDITAALKTYTPSGMKDKYVMFSSGGHSGQVIVIGLPSMRILKQIGVFTPEPWQGWGYDDETRAILAEGQVNGKDIPYADVHHPSLSRTNADYDGQYLFINDKSQGRVAVIDLKDFETKQIVKNPLYNNNHGLAVTPNTEYVVEGAQYSMPLGAGAFDLAKYKDDARGLMTYWKFDRAKGRIDQKNSFAVELPPYWQDLVQNGWGPSAGWTFTNSINTELATGGVEEGKPPFEGGTSRNDMDYLHMINWNKAEELVKAGKAEVKNGMPVISMKTAIENNMLYLIPEPKSPHGCDVTPNGDYIVVSGKLDPHVSVYSMKKISDAIAKGNFTKDSYGVPIIKYEDVLEAQVEVGLGPLHTQFDDKGYAYTSLFLDSAVARWTLGGDYRKDGQAPWKEVAKTPIQYNVGHISVIGGDTAHPVGQWLMSLNKWAIDRFNEVGPLKPQNLQLLDISQGGSVMPVTYDLPLGIGEPHYAQTIAADKLKPFKVYPQIGWDPTTQTKVDGAPVHGTEKVVRNGNTVEVFMTAVRSHFTPEHVGVKKGDKVIWHVTNIERAEDATHGFALPGFNVNLSLEPGETDTFTFVADHEGTYTWYCTEFCSALHIEMMGYFEVQP